MVLTRSRLFFASSIAILTCAAFQWKVETKPQCRPVLDAISATNLKVNLRFISSDLLEGRNTPSKGLDIAAMYIAAQFEKAGLEPGGPDGSYFQKTLWPPDGEKAAPTQNVIGVLRGSDPKLKDTYVLVTAHYDHLGMRSSGEGDLIYNGANDDGSGTVSVMEMATALGAMKQHPKRSIVFMTFFGEEKGLRGSQFYGLHPVFPLEKTIAQLNVEQIGRIDDDGVDMTGKANITGFDFSDLSQVIQAAGKKVGLEVYKNEQFSDMFFAASDNQSLADVGIPAHTVSVGYQFPDYHRVGDHWDKINYPNLALVTKALALTVLVTADSVQAPTWNEANPKTAKYVAAWKKLHPASG